MRFLLNFKTNSLERNCVLLAFVSFIGLKGAGGIAEALDEIVLIQNRGLNGSASLLCTLTQSIWALPGQLPFRFHHMKQKSSIFKHSRLEARIRTLLCCLLKIPFDFAIFQLLSCHMLLLPAFLNKRQSSSNKWVFVLLLVFTLY